MCQWGTDKIIRLKVAAELSHTGNDEWRDVGIDACIAPIVSALQAAGIDMLASCCGHGKAQGRIDLRDGRVLVTDTRADTLEQAQRVAAALHREWGRSVRVIDQNERVHLRLGLTTKSRLKR